MGTRDSGRGGGVYPEKWTWLAQAHALPPRSILAHTGRSTRSPLLLESARPRVCEGPQWGCRALLPGGQDPSGELFLRLLCPAWGFCGRE